MANGPFYEQGVYVGEIIAQGLTKSTNGNTQFVVRFKVLGRPDPHDPESLVPVQDQYERTIWMTITDKTAERVAGDIRQLGYQSSSFGPLDPNHPQHESFIGKQVDLYCKHETDQQGRPRERWNISRQGGLKLVPLEARDMRQLDMLFGKALKGVPPLLKGNGMPATSHQSEPGESEAVLAGNSGFDLEISDDDIPF